MQHGRATFRRLMTWQPILPAATVPTVLPFRSYASFVRRGMSHSPSTACTQCATVNEQRVFTKARDDKKVRLQAPDVMAAHVPTVLPLRLYASLVRRGMSHLPFTACTQLSALRAGKATTQGPAGLVKKLLRQVGRV